MVLCYNPVMREKLAKHPILVNLALWGFYYFCFTRVEKYVTVPKLIMHCRLDDLIPFVPQMIWFYVLWFPYIALTLFWFLKKEKRSSFWRLSLSCVIAMMLTLLFYCLVPNGTDIRPSAVSGNSLSLAMMRSIWAADTPNNVFPSIHVFISLMIDGYWQSSQAAQRHPCIKWISHIIALMICAATVFVKQHSVLDVLGGIVVALIVLCVDCHLAHKEKEGQCPSLM